MKRREFIATTLVGLTVAPVLAGCGGAKKSPRGVVKFGGTATYDGKPLPAGMMVIFSPEAGRQSAATVGEAGAFYAKYSTVEDGVEHGTIKVTVGWDEEMQQAPVPEGFEDLVKSYSNQDDGLQITVDKANTAFQLDFPKK